MVLLTEMEGDGVGGGGDGVGGGGSEEDGRCMSMMLLCSSSVVLLTEVERLTKDAQHALRRTMEKYTSSCRIILCCNSTSKVIPAIRSRCMGIRVAAPSSEEVSRGGTGLMVWMDWVGGVDGLC